MLDFIFSNSILIYTIGVLVFGTVVAAWCGKNNDDEGASFGIILSFIWPLAILVLLGTAPFVLAFYLGRKYL